MDPLWLAEYRIGLGLRRPTAHVLVTDIEGASAQEIMDELRESDPDAHAKLSEIVIIGDDGKVLPESLDVIVAWLGAR